MAAAEMAKWQTSGHYLCCPSRSRDMAAGWFNAPNNDFSKILAHATLKVVKTIPSGLLEKVVERLKAEFQPDEIYLFGSHAWGVPTDDSDVDLMVIVRDSTEKTIRRMQRAHRCLSGLGFAKDVLVPTRAQVDRYKHLRASLFHQVLAKGRKLYG
ncbi:MAG: nucleotidyltransferase domain-containing protein [Nitrospira sp.]|nr:MAG: nucleotidyltransferase domain-containing protein [Nitrospira sp.]